MTRCRAVYQTRSGVAKQCLHHAAPGSQSCRIPAHARRTDSIATDLQKIIILLARLDPTFKTDRVKAALRIARKAFLRVTV